jgi:hypothetical protein
MRADADEQRFDSDRRRPVIAPKKVFHYTAAATAGYALTAPVIEWLLTIARWMSSIALLSAILALVCLYTWFTATEPDRWLLLVYFVGFCCISAVMLAPMVILTRIALRCANNTDKKDKV